MEKYLHMLSRGDKIGLTLIRLRYCDCFMWIGLLKFVPYEARQHYTIRRKQSTNVVLYEHPEDYKRYLTHEGEYKPEARGMAIGQ